MDQKEFQEVIKKYNQTQDFVRKRALHHERMAKWLEGGTTICSMITTIIAISTLLNAPLIGIWQGFVPETAI